MKFLFTTTKANAPSTILNQGLLEGLGSMDGVSIDFNNRDYAAYDVVLFMGYDHDIEAARRVKPSLLIGVIDPRPPQKKQPIGADFILANGIEMKDWYLGFTRHVFQYFIYPSFPPRRKVHTETDTVKIGYHGNRIHLTAMFPRITRALEMVAEEHRIELHAMYNIRELGKWEEYRPPLPSLSIRHVQWDPAGYENVMANMDIGIVPNLIPIPKADQVKTAAGTSANRFNEHPSDYLLRFKTTSNPGRIFVFAQFGVPVVADMFPSALQVIDDGQNGCVCYGTDAWRTALKMLAENPNLRTRWQRRWRRDSRPISRRTYRTTGWSGSFEALDLPKRALDGENLSSGQIRSRLFRPFRHFAILGHPLAGR